MREMKSHAQVPNAISITAGEKYFTSEFQIFKDLICTSLNKGQTFAVAYSLFTPLSPEDPSVLFKQCHLAETLMG